MRPLAEHLIASADFLSKSGAERFDALLSHVKDARRPTRKISHTRGVGSWMPPDKAVKVDFRHSEKSFSLSLTSKDAGEFSRRISSNLEALYRAFRETKATTETGEQLQERKKPPNVAARKLLSLT
jgi:ParB family transcriptional regulator, chromosome partitioning protein